MYTARFDWLIRSKIEKGQTVLPQQSSIKPQTKREKKKEKKANLF